MRFVYFLTPSCLKNQFMKSILTSLLLLLGSVCLHAQMKPHLENYSWSTEAVVPVEQIRLKPVAPAIPAGNRFGLQNASISHHQGIPLVKPNVFTGAVQIQLDPKSKLPLFAKGNLKEIGSSIKTEEDFQDAAYYFLDAMGQALQIEDTRAEFKPVKLEADELGFFHVRFQQRFNGIKVYGGEVIVHFHPEKGQVFNGRYYPTPALENRVTPSISETIAIDKAFADVKQHNRVKKLREEELRFIDVPVSRAELVVFHEEQKLDKERLAWEVEIVPNITAKWLYFIDAESGEVLHKFNQICQLHGAHCVAEAEEHKMGITSEKITALPPDRGTASDLFGANQSINVYRHSDGIWYMIDAERPMHNASQSNFPNDAVGVIWTIDAQNTSPQTDDFTTSHIFSTNNQWNSPSGVSAHLNAATAYEYFRTTHSRNSINGQGGNVISVINVVDENNAQMDNAFWSGQAMFYGNGSQAFSSPLAKSLDVAGHEISHGVIQNTANLEYFSESGALNESFADIFGVMIDRDDWQLGEDVVNPQVFISGALRDMSNPHNGRTRLGQAGWQPESVSEQFFGEEDNQGVHINSGITNRAFFLIASQIGKSAAEQIYYRALTRYLTRSSRFVDLRIAVIQSANDLNNSNAASVAANAFDVVGITDGQGTNTDVEVGFNPGEEFILYSDGGQQNLKIVNTDLEFIANPLSSIGPANKPSISDDGSRIAYVDNTGNIILITIDWSAPSASSQILSDDPVWRNVAISKDGLRLAALRSTQEDKILVFNLVSGQGVEYTLFNPSTAEGVQTGEVQFADVMEWDLSGEFLVYDALNQIDNTTGTIDFWDIGFLKVWDNSTDNFGDGFISKLFTGIPENTSVGNPTFAKTAPNIMALDFVDDVENTSTILAINFETGAQASIWTQNDLGYPNYSVKDDQLIFDGRNPNTNERVVARIGMGEDKITPSPDGAFIYVTDPAEARWGIWFANGQRVLTDAEEVSLEDGALKVFPNPTQDLLNIELELNKKQTVQVTLFDLRGRQVKASSFEAASGNWKEQVSTHDLVPGNYVLRLQIGNETISRKIVKAN